MDGDKFEFNDIIISLYSEQWRFVSVDILYYTYIIIGVIAYY